MIRVRRGVVAAVVHEDQGSQLLKVLCEGQEADAVNYVRLTGRAAPGDTVSLNTTAVWLKLGTGGRHFVMAVEGKEHDSESSGHIMKVRYTPAQVRVQAVEEEDSPWHSALSGACDLAGMLVAVATLHSLVAPFAVAYKRRAPHGKLAYVMTDGAALPAAFSQLLATLREKGWLDLVITSGHAFGGDLEAVTVYSALHAARAVAACDACLVAMGPGVVGTGTPLGTTALEQAPILDGAAALGARTIAVPRISFADPRSRHYGLSHHTATALGRLAQLPTTVVFPELADEQKDLLIAQCHAARIIPRHRVVWEDAPDAAAELEAAHVKVTSMGRTPAEDPAFFAAAAAAGSLAARLTQRA